jgi:cation-transporting ATPase 13A1
MAPKPTPIFVFRINKWTVVTTKELIPGDIISLSYKKRSNGIGSKKSVDAAKTESDIALSMTSNDDIIPCDCLLLKGSAVVNEASLTGT